MVGPTAGSDVYSGQGTRQAGYQPQGQPRETGLEPHKSLRTLVRTLLGAHAGNVQKKARRLYKQGLGAPQSRDYALVVGARLFIGNLI